MSSANSDSLTSSFPVCNPLTSLCCLIALARPSSTILNRYGERGQPCLFPDFSGIASNFSPFKLMGCFLVGRFLMTASISLGVMGLFR